MLHLKGSRVWTAKTGLLPGLMQGREQSSGFSGRFTQLINKGRIKRRIKRNALTKSSTSFHFRTHAQPSNTLAKMFSSHIQRF